MKITTILISSAAVAALVIPSGTWGELDVPYLQSQIANHEARITNLENAVNNIETVTNTPAPEQVEVPEVTTPTPEPTVEPTPTPTPTPSPDPIPYGPAGHGKAITN